MTDRNDDIERVATEARAAAAKVADKVPVAVNSADDQTRKAAKRVFEKIKESREKAVKPAKPVRGTGRP